MLATTVHTTGVNWDGILANAAAVIVIFSAFGAIFLRAIKSAIKSEVTTVIDNEILPKLNDIQVLIRNHDTRIAKLEGVEEGKRYAVDAASVTTAERKARPTAR